MYKDKRGGGNWKKEKRGFGDRGFDRPELHDAVCADCGKDCQVPFRPNGRKPVLCRDCFRPDGEAGPQKRFDRPTFVDRKPYGERPSYGEKRSFSDAPRNDGAVEARLKAIEDKLDAIIEALQN